jgi:hypothetical protein
MDPSAQELLDQARSAHDPTDADRARVRRKLAVRIAAGTALGGSVAKASSVATTTLLKIVAPILVVSAVGGYVLSRPATSISTIEPAATSVERAPAVTLEKPAEPAATEVPIAAAPPLVASHAPHTKQPPPAASADLDAETMLLAQAQGAIQQKDFTGALAKLDAYDHAFPAGVLKEEGMAARVVALCGAGRSADAQTLARTFLARYPRSPLAVRVRSSCAGP